MTVAVAKRDKYKCASCGREDDAPYGTNRQELQVCRECYGKREDVRPRELNDLTGKEWAQHSRSVERYPDQRSVKQRLHGAAYSESLATAQVRSYTKPGDLVLDPFVGVGTTLDVCRVLGRRAIGIELNPDFVDLALQDLDSDSDSIQVVRGDALELDQYLPAGSVDMILTSPPYASLLKSVGDSFARKWREHSSIDPVANPRPYSELPNDLGNMDYEAYLAAIRQVFDKCFTVLRDGAYSVWVVKDFRNLRDGIPYVNLHGDVIEVAKATGHVLWDIRIVDQTQYRPLVCLGYPSRNFYLNIGHSYIVVFRKPAL